MRHGANPRFGGSLLRPSTGFSKSHQENGEAVVLDTRAAAPYTV
jgi:hypothetical protein